MMFESVAYAMAAPPGGEAAQGGGLQQFSGLIMMVAIFAIFYFVLIRPQQKQAKKHKEMLDALKKGDKVLTQGGIYGTVHSLDANVVNLIISENVKIKVARGYIASISSPEDGAPES